MVISQLIEECTKLEKEVFTLKDTNKYLSKTSLNLVRSPIQT